MQRCNIHTPNKRTVACRVTIHRQSICPHRKAIENSHGRPVRLWQMPQSGSFDRLRSDNAQERRDEKFHTIQLRNDSYPSSWDSYLRRLTQYMRTVQGYTPSESASLTAKSGRCEVEIGRAH